MSLESNSKIDLEVISCPLCSSPDYKTIQETKDHFCELPGIFTHAECTQCSHVFMNPRPTLETIANCYPEHYSPHAPIVEISDAPPTQPWYAKPPIRWIPGLKQLYYFLVDDKAQPVPGPRESGEKALEIGTGRGAYLAKIKSAGWDVCGIEPSTLAAEQATQLGFEVKTCSIENAQYQEGTFSAIFTWMVLEHLIAPQDALAKIYSWLKPGGTLYFSVPNYSSIESTLFGKYWIAWEAPRHLHHFRVRIIKQLLKDAGFEDTKIIHQRNIRDYYGSLGAMFTDKNPNSRFGKMMMRWFSDSPPLWIHLLTAPVGILLALIGHGGRITVITKKPL